MDCVYIEFNSKVSCNNTTKKPLVIGDTLVSWVLTNAKKCHFCYQVGHLVSKCPTLQRKKEEDIKKITNNIRLAKLYVKRNVSEKNVKAFGRKSYAKMAALRLPHNLNSSNPNKSQKPDSYTEINELRLQVDEMAKLLSAVAAKLGVIVEKKKNRMVTQQQSHNTKRKKKGGKVKAYHTATTLQHMNLVDTHGVYTTNNPEKTWASNKVQRRLDYVFTDAITVSLVTNIEQQTVTTAMITLNSFVVPDEIFGKIFIAAASPLPDIDGNSSSTSSKMSQDQPLTVLPDVILFSRLLPIPVAKQSINLDDLKDWTDQMEIESTVSPPVFGAADGDAWKNVNGCQRFSGWVAFNLVLGAIFKIKMALLGSLFQLLSGCIGLKSVSQDAIKLFCVEFASQESLNNATKVAISDEVFLITLKIAQSSDVASVSSPSLSVVLRDIPLGTSSNNIKTALGIFGVITSVKLKPAGLCGPKNFKSSFVESKSYAKTAAFVVLSGAAAADMNLNFDSPPKTVTPMLLAVSSVPNFAVEFRLASLESHLGKLSVLIKFLVESVGALVALVTKLLSTPSAIDVLVKKCVNELAKQNKDLAAVTTII
ncbi:hypothetical protein G9A89_015181 [Geosiphon pyriformis]|nr:hypothetical protein G9A89_015181 [Geosiphon pyriformis]